MTGNEIKFLISRIDNGAVRIHFTDGEEIIAKILSVSESEQDVICDIISTSKQGKQPDKNAACLLQFDEIAAVSAG